MDTIAEDVDADNAVYEACAGTNFDSHGRAGGDVKLV